MHHCSLEPGQKGICRARKNNDGNIICDNYGRATSLSLDPVEKKPLKMFYPGSMILSVGSFGCNLRCPFCQNHEISMAEMEETETVYISPRALADKALEYRNRGNIGVAFTYNEPLVVLEKLLPFIDAMNIDLKGFRQEYYRKLGGDLDTVKAFIVRAAAGCHVELTTLIVPGENDSMAEMEEEAEWIASIGQNGKASKSCVCGKLLRNNG